jgi:alpha-L-fucosidase 2
MPVIGLPLNTFSQSWVDKYNVTWTTPSKDFSGSMPTGNGDIGLNVWVEKNGDLLFLISKTDAYDENSTLLKLGRIRIHFSPEPFSSDSNFNQTLKLEESEILVKLGNWLNVRIWVDANNPVINIETSGDIKYRQEVFLETWRDSVLKMENTQVSDMFKNLSGPDPYLTIVYPDNYLKQEDRLIWFHHNKKPDNDGYEINLKLQGLEKFMDRQIHPLADRIFGACAEGENFLAENEKKLVSSKEDNNFRLRIYVLTSHPSTPKEWKNQITAVINSYKNKNERAVKKDHESWWKDFWNRSKIDITGANGKFDSSAYNVSRAYNLCRYMNACAGRGSIPIKFNGSIFSYGVKDNPDFRQWGGPGFWFQNQRLIYWPMLAQGDFDLILPWFNMYKNILPLQKYRTKKFYNHDGAFFPETITFWGAEVSGHYGWTPYEQRKNPSAESTYLTYYWQNSIEQMLMMYEYFNYTQDTVFAKEILLPHADEVTKFYDLHYSLDNQGKIHFGPAQSLETWHVAVNPLPEIAGLNYTINKLLSLPENLITKSQSLRWKNLLSQLSAIPMGKENDKNFLLPAQSWEKKMNIENPELYAVFPYRLFSKYKGLDTALNTFNRRLHKYNYCWHQDAVQAALLGLADTAKNLVINRTSPEQYNSSRFPTMWNAFHDWIPDIDHGGNLQLALTYMLMQCDDNKIYLLPSWPEEWDVDFKLHAPLNTIISASVRDGKITNLNVQPVHRKKDIFYNN